MWRAWALFAGAPLGPLLLLAFDPAPTASALQLSALVAGVALAGCALALAARARWDPDRGRHLARAASRGLLALPALAAAAVALPPGPRWLAPAVLVVLGSALARRARAAGPAGSVAAHALGMALELALFASAVVAVAGALAALGGPAPALDEEFARATLDVDAGVAPGPEPRCAPRAARAVPLAERGAHPRLSADGFLVWFDAEAGDGRRQVHRLDRRSGELRCWTCDEPGDNRRPAPSPVGRAVVFDTNRHASWRDPTNTEVHVVDGEKPGRASRRLTFGPGRDDHALYDPSGRGIVWSRARERDFAVVRASVQRGHGGVLLGPERTLARGGLRWVAPLAWSPDARALVTGRGHALRPLVATQLDPATGAARPLGDDAAGAGAVSFTADGTWMAVAATRPSGAASLVPASAGFLLARAAPFLGAVPAGPGESRVRLGPSDGELRPVALGAAGEWGEPSGVALAPDGTGFVLGQRRGADEERLLWVELDCAPGTS